MRVLLPLAAPLTLCACATGPAPQPQPEVREPEPHVQYVPQSVEVKVPVRCDVQIPARPAWPLDDPALVRKDLHVKGRAAIAELEQRRAYEARLEAALRACAQQQPK